MPLVIWRLPHPVRGIVVFLVIFVFVAVAGGFGMGLPELAVLALLASGVALVVATRTRGDTAFHPDPRPECDVLCRCPGSLMGRSCR
jgi:hypothetical protein